MSQIHYTINRKPRKHINYEERKILEYVYNRNIQKSKKNRKTQKELAEYLGWSESTLSRELRRGKVKQLSSDLEEYEAYSSDVAQCSVEKNWSNKGPSLKIGKDHKLAKKIESMLIGARIPGIKRLRYSPEAIVMTFEQKGWPSKTRLSARTIYNYVYKEVFETVDRSKLPRKGKQSKRPYKRIEKRLRPPECKRISQRPIASEERSEPGHWEMDCIESKKHDKSCLLTLVDRCKRELLIFKLGRQSQSAVIRRINGLERTMGPSPLGKSLKVLQ